MEFLRMEGEGGEQAESTLNPIFSIYKHAEEHPRATQEGYYNLCVEGSSSLVASPVHGGLEEVFKPPLYDKYEDDYLKDEGPKWDISSYSSSTGDLDQEERISLDFREDIPSEVQKEEQGLGSRIWEKATEVSSMGDQELPLHEYFEEQLENTQGKLQLEQQSWSQKMAGEVQDSHRFYDPVAEYVD